MATDRQSQDPSTPDDGEAQAVKHHRNRMAGMWAAELLGLIGHAAHDYAREVTQAHKEDDHSDDDKVAHRLAGDLHGKATIAEIRAKLAHLVHEARRHLLDDDKSQSGKQ